MSSEDDKSTGDEASFGRYRVIKPLGAGAMGAVYLARDEVLARDVAVKTIRLAGVSDFQAEMFRARFMNEARAIATLSHPNVVPVFDMGVEGTVPFLVMELAAGRSLDEMLEDVGTVGLHEATAVGVQVASALSAAHANGIIHRDVKPANILEVEPNQWKLADFGVAHVPDSSLTLAGQFIGSPAYAAPEALQRGDVSNATDVYSLAATLYEAVAGEAPHGERGLMSPGALEAMQPPRSLVDRCAHLPRGFSMAIMSALSYEPALRPMAVEFAAALQAAVSPTPAVVTAAPSPALIGEQGQRHHHRRRALLVAAGVASVLLIGVLIGVSASGSGGDAQGHEPASLPAVLSAADPGVAEGGSTSDDAEERAWRWRQAQAHLAEGNLEAAERELDGMLEDDPDDHAAARLREQIRAQRASAPVEMERDQLKRWRKVQKKLNEGRPDKAEKELEKLLDRYPHDDQARALLRRLRAHGQD